MAVLQFWYEFGSTYTWPAVARIGRAAQAAGVSVEWKPFLLMPLLISQGLDRGPFLPFPRKMAYMWRDLERRCAEHGIAYRKPSHYPPAEVLTSARLALLGAGEGWCQPFTEKAFELHWTEDVAIGTPENLQQALRHARQDPEAALVRARSDANKQALKAQTERAAALGLFGSPSFVVDGEVFWGDDRLEQALAWAAGRRTAEMVARS